ncbi:MAG: hypothetical protein WCW14_04795 [Candidatus Paceibacterota bacterium]
MSKKFDHVSTIHPTEDEMQTGRQTMDVQIEIVRNLLEPYDITNELPPTIQKLLLEMREELIDRFTRLGVSVNPEKVSIILEENVDEINDKLHGTLSIGNNIGRSGLLEGPLVVLKKPMVELQLLALAYHELLHSTGVQIVAQKWGKESINNVYVRQGLELFNDESPINPWVLEEGFCAYEESRYRERVGKILSEEYAIYSRGLDALRSNNLIDDDGRAFFPKLVNIEPELLSLNCTEDKYGKGLQYKLTLYVRSGLAGSLFHAILSPMSDKEKEEIIDLFYLTRTDLTHIPKIAAYIDKYHGKGTYNLLQKLPDIRDESNYEIICDLIQKLRKHTQ